MINKFMPGFLKGYSRLPISSPFGVYRPKFKSYHWGIDISIPSGTVLFSPVDGEVIKISKPKTKTSNGGAGLYVKVRYKDTDGNNYDIDFMHLSLVTCSSGKILAGDKIGKTGGSPSDSPNCGRSTGPHLHLQIRRNSNYVNPIDFITDEMYMVKTGKSVKGSNSGNFLAYDELKYLSQYKDKDLSKEVDESATESDGVIDNQNKLDNRFAPGIWQIIKLFVDPTVYNKQLMSSDISMQQGSLLSFFNRVCQKPLVEFCSDTYGNQFYFFVRRPPFNQDGFLRLYNTAITIEDEDIQDSNIGWYQGGAYSWYQFLPQAELIGIKEATMIIPAVFFPEFASIWGSNPLIVESNYYNYRSSGYWENKKDNNINNDSIIKNAIDDFKYIIESNAYLPFTREGSLTINFNRTIKRGNAIYLKKTGEVFYVDSVTHNKTGDGSNAQTNLRISRGMIKDFLNTGKRSDNQYFSEVSYFNIIDFGDYNLEDVNFNSWKNCISKWKVNPNSFGFFVKRQQLLIDLYNSKFGEENIVTASTEDFKQEEMKNYEINIEDVFRKDGVNQVREIFITDKFIGKTTIINK